MIVGWCCCCCCCSAENYAAVTIKVQTHAQAAAGRTRTRAGGGAAATAAVAAAPPVQPVHRTVHEENAEEDAEDAGTMAPPSRARKVSQPPVPTAAQALRECAAAATTSFSTAMKAAGFRRQEFGALLIATLTRGGDLVHAATEEFVCLRDSANLQHLLHQWHTRPESLTPVGSMATQRQSAWLCLISWMAYCS